MDAIGVVFLVLVLPVYVPCRTFFLFECPGIREGEGEQVPGLSTWRCVGASSLVLYKPGVIVLVIVLIES